MGRFLRKQARVSLGDQEQRDIISVQQGLIDLARKVVGEGHRDGAQFNQRKIVNQPVIGVGSVNADAASRLDAPGAEVVAHARHIVMQRCMRMADDLATLENMNGPLLPRKGGEQATKLHSSPRRMSLGEDAGAPNAPLPATANYWSGFSQATSGGRTGRGVAGW